MMCLQASANYSILQLSFTHEQMQSCCNHWRALLQHHLASLSDLPS